MTIRIKRSAVPNKVPTSSDLELGEIALNTYDGKFFVKKNDGAEKVVEISNVFKQGGQSVNRTIQDKQKERVSVFDYMSDTEKTSVLARDLIVDVTTSIQKAIDYVGLNGGEVFFPAGRYKLTNTLFVNRENVSLIGANKLACSLVMFSNNIQTIYITKKMVEIRGLSIEYALPPIPGATAIQFDEGSGFSSIEDVWIPSSFVGISCYKTVAIDIRRINIRGYASAAIQAEDALDIHMQHFVFDALNDTNGALGGIRLYGTVEAFIATDGDIVNGLYSMTVDAPNVNGVSTTRLRPSANRFTNVYFDTSKNGTFLNHCYDSDFTACWFSNSQESNLFLATTDGLRFTGGNSISSRKHGVAVSPLTKRVTFVNFDARENGVGNAGYSGIYFDSGCTDFSVIGGIFGGPILYSTGTTQQEHGITIAAGASTNYSIIGANVAGTTGIGISDNGTGSKEILSCAGYNLTLQRTFRDFGVIGNGVVDDTYAAQKALDWAASVHGTLVFENISIRTTSTLIVRSGMTIQGAGTTPYDRVERGIRGSWFYFDHATQGIQCKGSDQLDVTSGILLKNFGTIRPQPAPTTGWVAGNFDWDLVVLNCDVIINDLMLLNPSKGLLHDNGNGGRLTIDGLRGQPMKAGIAIGTTYDSCRLENIHFWPFWKDDANVNAYTRANLIALDSNRFDNPFIHNFFSIFANIGWRIGGNSNGSLSRAQVTNMGLDGIGGNGIVLTPDANNATGQFTNVYIYGADPTGTNSDNGIYSSAPNAQFVFHNLRVSQTRYRAIVNNGANSLMQVNGLVVDNWNVANNGSEMIAGSNGGKVNVEGKILYNGGNGAPLINSLVYARVWDYNPAPFTPPVNAQIGTVTTSSSTFEYRILGDELTFKLDLSITTNGTAAGSLEIGLPIAAFPGGSYFSTGREVSNSGVILSGSIAGSVLSIVTYNNQYPGGNGTRIIMSGSYRIAS